METKGLADLGEARGPEFQVVIIADYDDGRMFPLTEDSPKCLLPFGNRPLLSYQLDMLEKSGAIEIFLIAPQEYQSALSQFLAEYIRGSMHIELVVVEDLTGSADGLRAVADRIRGDFICLASDVISEFTLGRLTSMHRAQISDLTMLLSAVIPEESEKKGAPRKIVIDDEDQEYLGIDIDGRVVIKCPALELEESFSIAKPLLKHCTNLTLRNDVIDVGIYVMSKWILELLTSNQKILSVRTDLVPFLVKRQFQTLQDIKKDLPGIEHRRRPLDLLDVWLAGADSIQIRNNFKLNQGLSESISMALNEDTLINEVENERGLEDKNPLKRTGSENKIANKPSKTTPIVVGTTSTTTTTNNSIANHEDILRCYSIVIENEFSMPVNASFLSSNSTLYFPSLICQRVSTMQTFMNLNRDLPNRKVEGSKVWAPLVGYRKKELSVVGDGCEFGDKGTLKLCAIGKNVRVGARSKINNCVIMDAVQIGESCTIQNSVVCAGATIESNCNLNECYIGSNARIMAGSKMKSETVSCRS